MGFMANAQERVQNNGDSEELEKYALPQAIYEYGIRESDENLNTVLEVLDEIYTAYGNEGKIEDFNVATIVMSVPETGTNDAPIVLAWNKRHREQEQKRGVRK